MRKHYKRNYAVRLCSEEITKRFFVHPSDIMLNTWSRVKNTATTTGSLISIFLILLLTILAVEERHGRKDAMARIEQLEKQLASSGEDKLKAASETQQKSQADKRALDRIQELERKQATIQTKLDAANTDIEHVSIKN